MKESQLEYIGLTKFDRDCINILIRNELKLLESGNTDCGEFEIMILKGLLKKINTAKKADENCKHEWEELLGAEKCKICSLIIC